MRNLSIGLGNEQVHSPRRINKPGQTFGTTRNYSLDAKLTVESIPIINLTSWVSTQVRMQCHNVQQTGKTFSPKEARPV